MITVLPLGPGNTSLMTQECRQLLHAENLVLRTARHPAAEELANDHVTFQSCDDLYDQYEDFDELYEQIASRILHLGSESDLVYAVPDPDSDGSVRILRRQKQVPVKVLPGVSWTGYYLSLLPQPFSASGALLSCTATSCHLSGSDTDILITEIHSRALAGDIKIKLCDLFDEESDVVFFSASLKSPAVIPLYMLDRQKVYDHTTAVFVPAVPFEKKTRFTFEDLMHIMGILRSQDGCPWDREQTHQSLRPYLLEEAYEAAEAIDRDDMEHLCDELGDVLLQIAFHASIAESTGDFNRTDVATAISRKMERRHPRIFAHTEQSDAEETWESIKMQERDLSTLGETLKDVCVALPALTRAAKIQKKIAKHTGDNAAAEDNLRDAASLIQDIMENLPEKKIPGSAFGKLLFLITSAARLSGMDAEESLTCVTEKIIELFSGEKSEGKNTGKSQNPLTIREMNVYLRTAL